MDASPHGAAYERGVRVLFDRADPPAAGTRIVPNSTPAAHPTREEFDRLIRKFVFDALRADKLIRRGEWWQAQASLHALRQHVLTAIEWHARVTRPDADVWYDGRFLDRWADPRAAEALPSTFAGCVPDDLRGALAAAIGTFLWVAAEVAERLGFPRLDATYGDALRWLNRLGSRP
jgi:aminoglycoside 6-adenylyltransferase